MSKSPKWLVNSGPGSKQVRRLFFFYLFISFITTIGFDHKNNLISVSFFFWQDIFSTRVLVPVRDGLVELFSFIMVIKMNMLAFSIKVQSNCLVVTSFIQCVLSSSGSVSETGG